MWLAVRVLKMAVLLFVVSVCLFVLSAAWLRNRKEM
jgi:hypothetical protein